MIDSTKKVMEAIGTSLTAQTMMLHTQGWPQQDVSYFFLFILSCFLYLSLYTDCKQSPLFGEVRRTSQKISANKRTQIDDSVARGNVQMRHAAARQYQFFPRLLLCSLFLCFYFCVFDWCDGLYQKEGTTLILVRVRLASTLKAMIYQIIINP